MVDILRDTYGRYESLANVDYDGVTVEYRKYANSVAVKHKGGCYSFYCEDTTEQIFRRNEFMLMNSLNKFIEDNKNILQNKPQC